MSVMATTALYVWRKTERLNEAQAGRRFGISAVLYADIENWRRECPPAVALRILERTDGAVGLADLPGCEGMAGADPVTPSAARELDAPPAPGTDGGEASEGASPPMPDVIVMGDRGGGYSVAIAAPDAPAIAMTPRQALVFAIEVQRAALLALAPGSIPI